MPGYVIHLIEADLVLERLLADERIKVTNEEFWKKAFLLGSLLPDAANGSKQCSHFWKDSDIDKILKTPELNTFQDLYLDKLSDPLYLGYYVHLHLDKMFFEQFFYEYVEFWDGDEKKTDLNSTVKSAYLKKTNEVVDFQKFFSDEYLYGDYTKMNAYLINKYGVLIPEYLVSLNHYEIAGVKFTNLKQVLKEELTQYIAESNIENCSHLSVFSDGTSVLDEFLRYSSDEFIKLLN